MLLERMKRSTGIPTGLATWVHDLLTTERWDVCDGYGIWFG